MTRITTSIANIIATQVAEHAFADRITAATERLQAAACAAYRSHYGEAAIERMQQLPDGWLPKCAVIDFRINGQRHRVRLNERLPLTYQDDQRYITLQSAAPEAIDLQHASQTLDTLISEQRAAANEAERAIKRFGTVKALIKGWPEIEPFARKFLDTSPALPDVIPAHLNAKLGLPVEDAA